jgi:HD-GYP domain-containing protein (c-di-GMP phosphodiesterase class II)
MGIEIAEGHHERWDGKGYPRGLAGEQIPLSARIVALADVFDALTSKRQYKEAFDFNLSAGMIRSESGSHFDPEIVRVFLENIDRFREIYLSFNVKAERKARAI